MLADIRDPDVTDLSLVLQLDQGADGFLDRDLRVRPVELVQRDLLQAPEAALALGAQLLRPAVRLPPARAGTLKPALGGDNQIVRIWIERLRDEALADLGPVRVRRVDERDAQLDDPPQRRQGLRLIRRIAPDAAAGDAHGAETEPGHRQVPADVDRARIRRAEFAPHLALFLRLCSHRNASPPLPGAGTPASP